MEKGGRMKVVSYTLVSKYKIHISEIKKDVYLEIGSLSRSNGKPLTKENKR